SVARRTGAAGQEPAQRALARLHGFLHLRNHALATCLHLRGRPRCLRPAKDLPVRDTSTAETVLVVEDPGAPLVQGDARAQAVRGVSFELRAGETLAIVGESGSGKSVAALSTVKLLPDNAETTGSVRYRGTEMLGADE